MADEKVTLDDVEPLPAPGTDTEATDGSDVEEHEPEAPELPDSDIDPGSGRRLTSQEKDDRAAEEKANREAREYSAKQAKEAEESR